MIIMRMYVSTQDLGNTLQSVLCNLMTAKDLCLDKIDALDIAFGTQGYKLPLAARSDRVCICVHVLHGAPVCP